jgi:hypothetical protein
MAKSQADILFERLHANGLRKRVARELSSALSKANGSRASSAANSTITELRKLVADLESRAKGGTASTDRSAAAKKAAATRKREANKRSAAAKKAAQTRAKSTRSSSSRSSSSRTTARSGSRS